MAGMTDLLVNRQKHPCDLARIKTGTLAVCKSSAHFTHASNIWCMA